MNKTCSICNISQLIENFHKCGSNYRRSECKTCRYPNNKRHTGISLNKKEYQRNYSKNRRKVDIEFKLRYNLRIRINKLLNKNWKSRSAIKDLGISIKELKQHLESKWEPGMTWDNYGQWHIDHIIPLSKFNLKNPEEFKKACHYTNLQPLWALDNIRKGAK